MTAPDRSLELGPRRRPLAARESALPRTLMATIIVTVVLVALGFSALRGAIIDLRYRAAEVVREERALEAQRRELAVRVRELRDPRHLAELASRRGFGRPERVVHLQAQTRPGAR